MEKALEKSTSIDKSRINNKMLVFDAAAIAYLLGCLTVAVVQPDKTQLQNLAVNFPLFLSYMLIGAGLSWALNGMGVTTLGGTIFEPEHLKGKGEVKSWYATFWGGQFLLTFGVTLIAAVIVTNASLYELFSARGFAGARNIFTALATPNLSILPVGLLAIIETIYIAFLATVIAIPVAFVLAFFAAKNIMSGSSFGMSVYFLLRTGLNLTRSIEPVIWAIIFSVWVGIGPFAGMLALMIHSISSLTKQYSEMIEAVDEGPIEGISATGANAIQVIWYAIVPQLILPYISFTIYRWDINVRMATIIGLVGGGGIGTLIYQFQGQAMWNEVGCLALLIVAVVWIMDTASAYIREALK